MESLEIDLLNAELLRIEDLEMDLFAEIVFQEEDGPESTIAVNRSVIIKPDRERRKDARAQLQQIYNFSECPELVYEAGKALGYSDLRIWFHNSLG